jgi:hypothetical protein
VAVNLVRLDPELRHAVERARMAVAADGSLDRPKTASALPVMPPEVRDAIRGFIADGTYARAVAAVVVEDPELADL